MAETKAFEQARKKVTLADELDEIIKSVGTRVKTSDLCPGEYADTVKALAALVEARARLI